jgi:hypothetical protein
MNSCCEESETCLRMDLELFPHFARESPRPLLPAGDAESVPARGISLPVRRQSGAPSILPASQHGEASDTITNVISTRLSTHYFC